MGALVWADTPNIIGRKPTIFWSSWIIVVGAVLQAAPQNIGMFLFARMLIGFGSAAMYIAFPVWMAECLPDVWRIWALALFNVFLFEGSLLTAGITYQTSYWESTGSWRLPGALQGVFSIFSLIFMPFLPESPQCLIRVDWKDDALHDIAKAWSNGDTTTPEVQKTFNQIMEALDFEMNVKHVTIRAALKDAGTRKRLCIVGLMAVISLISGATLFMYYLGTSLDQAGITDTLTQFKITLRFYGFLVVVSTAGSSVIDIWGRRFLGMSTLFASTLVLFVIGALTKFYDIDGTNNPAGVYANIVMMFLSMGVFCFGWTPLVYVYIPEIMTYETRTAGVAFANFWQNVFGILATFCCPLALDALGWKLYMMNGAWNILELISMYYMWVETKGRSPEEIAELFDGPRATVTRETIMDQVSMDVEKDPLEKASAKVSERELGEKIWDL